MPAFQQPVATSSAKPTSIGTNLVIIMLGLTILSLGITIAVSTSMGVQPWDVLHLGVSGLSGLSLGRVSQLTGLAVVGLTLLLGGKSVNWLTVANALIIGFEVDLFLTLVPRVSGLMSLLYLEFGVILAALGMALYLWPNWGAGPRDSLMLVLHERSGWPVARIRIAMDLVAIGSGYLLGGPVGIGTVVGALTLGPWLQLFTNRLQNLSR